MGTRLPYSSATIFHVIFCRTFEFAGLIFFHPFSTISYGKLWVSCPILFFLSRVFLSQIFFVSSCGAFKKISAFQKCDNEVESINVTFLMTTTLYCTFAQNSNARSWKKKKKTVVWTYGIVGYVDDGLLYIYERTASNLNIVFFMKKTHTK